MGYYMAGGDIVPWGGRGGLDRYSGGGGRGPTFSIEDLANAALETADAMSMSPSEMRTMLGPAGTRRGMISQPSQPWLGGLDPNPGGRRPPRMNAANPAAMRRAARRIQSFAKAAQKMINFKPRRRASSRSPIGRRTRRK